MEILSQKYFLYSASQKLLSGLLFSKKEKLIFTVPYLYPKNPYPQRSLFQMVFYQLEHQKE